MSDEDEDILEGYTSEESNLNRVLRVEKRTTSSESEADVAVMDSPHST